MHQPSLSPLSPPRPPERHRPGRQAGPLHDGHAAGDGLQRPAAEPAAAEEARLQPAAHRQRAGADGRGQPEGGGRRSALREEEEEEEGCEENYCHKKELI